jgi:hypothetical protein
MWDETPDEENENKPYGWVEYYNNEEGMDFNEFEETYLSGDFKQVKTDAEIEAEITRICAVDSNFINDNYGSESADNGDFEIFYSQYNSESTLRNFVNWIFNK